MVKKLKKFEECEELDRDRILKQKWEYIKTWNFEDYKENHKAYIRNYIILLGIIVFLMVAFLGIYLAFLYTTIDCSDKQLTIGSLLESEQYNEDILEVISKNECLKINQSYGYVQRLNFDDNPQLLIFCSENNIIIQEEGGN